MKMASFVFFILVLSGQVFADGTPAEGAGTENDPYQIETLDNLLWLSTTEAVWDSCYFLQTADIDASDTESWNEGAGFSPIGLSNHNSFKGAYNGGDHIIYNLYINRPDDDFIGLFGSTDGAAFENLGIEDVNIAGFHNTGSLVGCCVRSSIYACHANGNVTGDSWVGGLVGGLQVGTMFRSSYGSGSVTGNDQVGGLVGYTWLSTIRKSFATCSVNGGNRAGGLLGSNNSSTTISECYATGNVTGYDDVGGLVGNNSTSNINDSYASGNVNGEYRVGGFVGGNYAAIIGESYAAGLVTGETEVGGLVGFNWVDQVENCIWNIEISGQINGIGSNYGTEENVLGMTTTEMQMMSTYTDIYWDFWDESINGDEDIWGIDEDINEGYPFIYDIEIPVNIDENAIHSGGQELRIENYPNPFNPVTNICYEIGESGDVLVSIYNIKGQKVETLVNGYCEAGKHTIIWNAEEFGSGVYFIYFESGTTREVKKITLLK